MAEIQDIVCEKNPGHQGFIPFKDLTLLDLPIEVRDIERLHMVKRMGSRVVRLVVDKIKQGKIRVAGTGSVIKLNKEYYIMTNNCIVKCDEEVKNCRVEFNYDSHNRSIISISRGVKLAGTCLYREFTLFTFHPVPEFIKQLDLIDYNDANPRIYIKYANSQFVEKYTDSHFKSSQFIYYTDKDINDEQIDMMCLIWSDNSISYLKSAYFRIQPIPSKIQDLTNIKIHIVEDDGNSREISGNVVKFGEEYVVKISESIYPDEVMKCYLVSNGEISFGTRLYFEPIKSRDFFSNLKGVDLIYQMAQCPINVWSFDFDPKPRHVAQFQDVENNVTPLCCISHPHGSIKMITFGRWLGKSIERVDDEGQHIVQPREDVQYKEVKCVKYSCKTCPGSSGSVIFPLHKMADIGHGLVHFMGYRVERPYLLDGELIQNINMAWIN